MSVGDEVGRVGHSEIAFLLLLLHRGRAVVVDDAALALGGGGQQHLLDDLRQRRRRRSRPRRSADSSRACGSAPSSSAAVSPGSQRHALVVDHDQRRRRARTTGRSLGEIQRHDRDVLQVDVLPDVELGPVRQREHADALALVLARVVEAPQLRAAGASGPSDAAPSGTRRRAPWRATSPRRGARRRTPRRSRTCRAPASAPAVFMTSVCTAEPCVNGLMPRAEPVGVDVHEQLRARAASASRVAERDHLAELPGRVDVQQRERRLGRDRTPSAPGAASPSCPCRSSRASPAARTRRPPRA